MKGIKGQSWGFTSCSTAREAIKDKIMKESGCIAIEEIGIEDVMSYNKELKLWSKVPVIQCRVYTNSPEARDVFLKRI